MAGFVGTHGILGSKRNAGAVCDWRARRGVVFASADVGLSAMSLTPELEKMVSSLNMFPDPKVRYQQLLHYATTLKPMDPSLKTPENKVPGCLSTVFVDARLNPEDQTVTFQGDSDAQLTKGLVALLVNGLSGATVEKIVAVDPEFIKASGLAVSLTPGRNNGFLNMLKLMKLKAKSLKEENGAQPEPESAEVVVNVSGGPVCEGIAEKLKQLKPVEIDVEDFSAEHAHHASKPDNAESHVRVKVVAEAFNDLSLVKRHQVIYALLDPFIQGGVHALQIKAQGTNE